ncbi:MAG TPA: acyl-CoA thioester hydrolase/BAAT C-terminal domain-containing protein [Candidatus Baltobacteraceae bacterium]|nr:acyl-CoA thioester hydrolase/BAAT C-terminal domain-containing protein [Candidatus Baltobacteraceae bacterium]
MLNLVFAAVLCSNVTAPFTGTICTPNDGKKRAAMVLLGGSEGGNSMGGAASTFARHGYVAASVAYFGLPGLPKTLVSVPVETVKHAIDALRARPDVDASRLGILGISKGGEFALLAASTYPQIKAVVAIVPSPYAFMGLTQAGTGGCSWSKNGKDLPCIPADSAAGMRVGMAMSQGQPVAFKPFYDASRAADAAATKAATFPMERINGPVLCLDGEDDQMWNSRAQCDGAIRYLRAHHHRYADREINYPNAGHTFIMATHGRKSALIQESGGGMTFLFGGTPQGDVAAATASWKAIWAFLRASLGLQR